MSAFKFCTLNSTFLLADSLTGATAASGYSVNNIISQNRGKHFRRSTTGTSSTFTYTLASGSTIKPEYLIMARADILRLSDSAAVAITFEGATDSGFTIPETVNLTLDTADLKGRTVQDIVWLTTFTTAYRYWRVVITTTQSSYHEFSKLIFGTFIDLDREPLVNLDYSMVKRSGDNYHSRQQFRLEFKGVSNAKRTQFYQDIHRHANTKPLFIYDGDDAVLEGAGIAQVRVKSVNYKTGFYDSDISMVLQEVY